MGDIKLIAIAGLVGVGKTTLAVNLARRLQARPLFEEYAENPFLPKQLAGDRGAALLSELFFLLSRARQLDGETVAQQGPLVADYVFAKNRIFAEMFLDGDQFETYRRVEDTVAARIAVPDVLIYLQDRVEHCLKRIRQRGRDFEQGISARWLLDLVHAYERLLADWTLCPIVVVRCCDCDVRRDDHVAAIAAEVRAVLGQPT